MAFDFDYISDGILDTQEYDSFEGISISSPVLSIHLLTLVRTFLSDFYLEISVRFYLEISVIFGILD